MKIRYWFIAIFTILFAVSPSVSFGQNSVWQQTSGPLGGSVNTFLVAPSGDIYAGLDMGVYRSTNSGKVWTDISRQLDSASVVLMVLDSTDHVIAATSGYGIYRYVDDKAGWVSLGLTSAGIYAIATGPGGRIAACGSTSVYTSRDLGVTWNVRSIPNVGPSISSITVNSRGDLFLGMRAGGFYRSTDDGVHWMPADSVLKKAGVNCFYSANDGRIFAGTSGVCRSTDDGMTWTQAIVDSSFSSIWIYGITSVDKRLACISNRGVYYSSDTGVHWYRDTMWVKTVPGYCLASTKDGGLFVGTLGDIMYSSGSGSVWEARNEGVLRSTIWSLLCAKSGVLFASASSGLWNSSDRGEHWVRNGLEYSSVQCLAQSQNGHLFVGTSNGLFRSTDQGIHWDSVLTFVGAGIHAVTGLYVAPGDTIYAVAAGHGIYRSGDYGTTWQTFGTDSRLRGMSIITMCQSGTILTGSMSSGLLRSTDGGLNWELPTISGASIYASAIVVSPEAYVYSGSGACLMIKMGVCRSSDLGATWAIVGADKIRYVYSICIADNGDVLVGASNGIFISSDNGVSWRVMNDGLKLPFVLSTAQDNVGNLYAGTFTSGVYRTSWTQLSTHRDELEMPARCELYQNYPNPFNPTTTIAFTTARHMNVSIVVYDCLGRVISTLADGMYDAGEHRVIFDGSNISSGMCFYRMAVNGAVSVKKMVIEK